MSKIERLIEELCPDGVEYKKLEQIITFQNGKGHEKDVNDAGEFIIVNAKFISTDGKVKKYCSRQICPVFKEDILMVMSDLPNGKALAKCFIVGINDKYSLNQRIGRLTVKEKEIINYKFLYYILNRNKQLLRHDNKVDQTNLKKSDILNILIPVPPLPIQEEIVRILDSFTEKTNELKAQLEEELEARKKQYEWYRDSLLKFDESVPSKPLEKVLKIKNGKDYKHLNSGNVPVYGSGGIMTFVDTAMYDKPSVLIPRKGSISNLYYVDVPFWNVDTIFYTEINISIVNPKFVYYYLQTQKLEKLNKAGGVPSLTQSVLNKVKIPLPPLEEQQRIVDILDRFDKLCNDISEGLPAEIDARQKQYEYYRDKLLTFKRLEDREGIEDERV